MPKKFLTAQSATFKVLPADTGIAKALDDPMGVKGLNPFHDLMAGFVKVDAQGNPYTVGVLPDTVSILGSDTILIAEDPSDTFTFSIPTTATPQLAGLGIETPGEADNLVLASGGKIESSTGLIGTAFAPIGGVTVNTAGSVSWDDGFSAPDVLLARSDVATLGLTGGMVFNPPNHEAFTTVTEVVTPGPNDPGWFINGTPDLFPGFQSLSSPLNIRTNGGGGLQITDTDAEDFGDAAFAPLMISVDIASANVALSLVNRDTAKQADYVATRWKVRDGITDSFVEGIFEYQSSGLDDGQSWFGVAFDNSNTDVIQFNSDGSVSASRYTGPDGVRIAASDGINFATHDDLNGQPGFFFVGDRGNEFHDPTWFVDSATGKTTAKLPPGNTLALELEATDTSGNNDLVQVLLRAHDASSRIDGTFELQNSGDGDGSGWFGWNFITDGGPNDAFAMTSDGRFVLGDSVPLGTVRITLDGATGAVSASGGYIANGQTGIDTTITTGSLVGKTITITKGLITGFA